MEKGVRRSVFKRSFAHPCRAEEMGDPAFIGQGGPSSPEAKQGDAGQLLRSLRDTVVRYDRPTEPVSVDEWEALSS